ncbi:MAG TPA: DUF4416 family protein [Syntrophorhabdaceae bacterium]|nr:DUF4416 family protein [Syntrophorhabdaceae bacterium]
MGIAKKPEPVKLFAGILFKSREDLESALSKLEDAFGSIEEKTPVTLFCYTRYYDKEMGENLMRAFVLFETLVDRELLPEIKLKSNEVEQSFALEGRRSVNIDPGYIALEHVILATTKGYSHRVYLGRGIYADLTLRYHEGTYKALEWTYPDYRATETITMFNGWRDRYRKGLRC